MRHLLTRAKWISVGLVIGLTVITLWAQEPQQFNRGINVTQGNITTSGPGYIFSGKQVVRDFRTQTSVTAPRATTYTAAQVLSGYISRTGLIAAVIDVFPQATDLAAAIPGVAAGQSFMVVVDPGLTPLGTVRLDGSSSGVTYGAGCASVSSEKPFFVLINFTSATAYTAVCNLGG